MSGRRLLGMPLHVLVPGAGVLLCALYYLVPSGAASESVWLSGVIVVTALLASAVGRIEGQRIGWMLVALAQLCTMSGDLVFSYNVLQGIDAFPSLGDVLYLANYPLMAIALTTMARSGKGHLRLQPTIDGIILSAATALAVWIFFVSPVLADGSEPLIARAVAAAYPIGDLLLLVTCTQLMVHRLRPSRSLWLLLLAVGCNLVADIWYLYLETYGSYGIAEPVDALWWGAYLVFFAAASHPSASSIAGGTDVDASADLRVSRMVLLSVAAIAAPVLHLALYVVGDQSHTATLLGGTLALFALVIARLWLVAADLEQSRSDLRYRATHDELTGVANRSLFNEWLYAAERARSTGGVLLLDVDDFKAVNDSFGHSAGDAVLRAVASRVSAVVPAGSLVARIGGDEFAVLVSVSADRLEGLAGELVAVVREPVVVGAHRLQTSVSCGAAPLGVGGHALRVADEALYEAKHAGRDRHVVLLHDTPTDRRTIRDITPIG